MTSPVGGYEKQACFLF